MDVIADTSITQHISAHTAPHMYMWQLPILNRC